jgi:hypothetical protein
MAQIVGPSGRVIGVDFNDTMLALSRKYFDEMGRRLGFLNVEFLKGRIQDLALDCEKLDDHLAAQRSPKGWTIGSRPPPRETAASRPRAVAEP